MRFFERSERRFMEREARGVKPRGSDGGRAPFRYFPGGGSMGFVVTGIPAGSRVAEMFEAEFGEGSLEVAKSTPGWRPWNRRA